MRIHKYTIHVFSSLYLLYIIFYFRLLFSKYSVVDNSEEGLLFEHLIDYILFCSSFVATHFQTSLWLQVDLNSLQQNFVNIAVKWGILISKQNTIHVSKNYIISNKFIDKALN